MFIRVEGKNISGRCFELKMKVELLYGVHLPCQLIGWGGASQRVEDGRPGMVGHACNPSYSGGRDQEDLSLKSAQAKSSQDPISKKHNTKNWLVEWLKVKALSSNPSTAKKKKNEDGDSLP
jgi:hypothetical protein